MPIHDSATRAEMTPLKTYWVFSLLCVFSLVCASPAPPNRIVPLYWEKSIGEALASRDDFYKKCDIDRSPAHFSQYFSADGAASLEKKLTLLTDSLSPWHHFLWGMYNAPSSIKEAQDHFNKAIARAGDNPGLTWVLFIEFQRVSQFQWAEKCLWNLERMMLENGACRATIIALQLLDFSRQTASLQIDYEKWSRRFDNQGRGPALLHLMRALPRHPTAIFTLFEEYAVQLNNSWFVQASAVEYLYRWLRCAILVFIIVSFLVFSIAALPVALHPLSELYPSSLSPRIRFVFSLLIYMCLLNFGLIPFFILTAILLWQHLEKPRRILLSLCLTLIVLSPLDAWLMEALRASLSPNHPVGLLRTTLDEGYSVETEYALNRCLTENAGDPACQCAAAILSLKQHRYEQALTTITSAERLSPHDPVIIITAGNINFALGNFIKASEYYIRSINLFPDYEMAYYNLGQVHLATMKMVEGSDLISRATRVNSRRVNAFVEDNTSYFGAAWPPLRHFMQPEYKPGHFWWNLFLMRNIAHPDLWQTWSPAFFGLPPLYFMLLMPLAIIFIISARSRSARNNRIKKVFFCKLCGIPLCKKCKTGNFCLDCLKVSYQTNNETADQTAETRILRNRRIVNLSIIAVLDLLFPGAGLLYHRRERMVAAVALLAISSLVFAAYCSLLAFSFPSPAWITQNYAIACAGGCGIYSIVFAIKAINAFSRGLQSKEKK
jgi:tetratricopeptide (TPR) repeat protein